MQLFLRNILYWLRNIRFRRYILGFCVAIYFHENSSTYAVGGIVAGIDAVHGINSIPAWDVERPASAGDFMKQWRGKSPSLDEYAQIHFFIVFCVQNIAEHQKKYKTEIKKSAI